jgi:tRNA(Ile2) C34 agmatinyltransferase TiaS
MKSATIPPLRVEPEFRLEVEAVLERGESLSEFVESALRASVAQRKNQAEFVRRGIASIEKVKSSGGGIPAEVVIAKLEAKLAEAKRVKARRGR